MLTECFAIIAKFMAKQMYKDIIGSDLIISKKRQGVYSLVVFLRLCGKMTQSEFCLNAFPLKLTVPLAETNLSGSGVTKSAANPVKSDCIT